ncbi:MAG: M1 family metallopeptidase [Planctomycetes bacterium]|nr:M1 family metallopeptidase [Planctomycetota bacterium]MCB9917971.1 M1 family metallopeptidase [Planctomycetota bacterium]
MKTVSIGVVLLVSAASCAVLSVGPCRAQEQRQTSGGALRADQAWFDVQHVLLALRVDADQRSIDGTMTMRARVLGKSVPGSRAMSLHLDEALSVRAVHVGKRDVSFVHEGGLLRFQVDGTAIQDENFRVAVTYGGAPRVSPRPPWQGGFTWSQTKDGSPWIATSCQGEGADLWWPCKDHPSDEAETFDLAITVKKPLYVATNGVLEGIDDLGDWQRYRWHSKNPLNNYGVALNIAPYVVIERSYASVDGTKVPAFFYALPESAERAAKVLPEFLEHVRHMEETCGPYPWRNEKYAVVETPHLGMEHQTIIAYGNKFRKQAFDYDWLHHHEMCHEWWANLVTCRDWKDMWIHEGIGTYMQALWIERSHGKAGLRTEMLTKRRMLRNQRAVAPRVAAMDSQEIYFGSIGNDIYYKGSWICHSLRWVLGDERFFRVLRRWAYPTEAAEKRQDGLQARFTDTDELLAIAEDVSGEELDWFFEVYLRRASLPRLSVQLDGKIVRLQWHVEDGLPFDVAVPVRVGGEDRVVRMADKRGSFELSSEDDEFEIDPDARILMEEPTKDARQRAGKER